jgi:HK97 family phage major capsid protein
MSNADYKSAVDVEVKNISDALAHLQANDGVKVDGNTVHIDEKVYNEIAASKAKLAQLKSLMSTDSELSEIKGLFDEAVAEKQAFQPAQAQYKTFGEQFADSTELKDMFDSKGTKSRGFEIESADVVAANAQVKDVYTMSPSTYTSTVGVGTVRNTLPLVQGPQLRQRIRDLFPVNRTSSNLIEFFRVVEMANDGRGAAAVVPERDGSEFGLKPKSNLTFESDQASVRTIAHWVAVHRNTLTDKSQLRSVIDNQLFYGLALVEDDELLNGDGTGEHIRGILNTPGILTYTKAANGDAADQKSDTLRRAQTLSALSLFPATGYVLHPNDWEDVELQKTVSGGDGQYMLVTNVSVGANSRVWRLPVVESPSIAEGHFLTGAFGQGVQIWDREQANIRVSDSHADYFARNALAVLAEERLALTVTHPQSIVHGTFA